MKARTARQLAEHAAATGHEVSAPGRTKPKRGRERYAGDAERGALNPKLTPGQREGLRRALDRMREETQRNE